MEQKFEDRPKLFMEICAELLALEKNRATLLDWLWSDDYMKVIPVLEEMNQNTVRILHLYNRYTLK